MRTLAPSCSASHRRDHLRGTEHVDGALHIVSEDVEAHFGAHLFQGPCLEVASSHPVLYRTEYVFDSSSSDTDGVGHALEPCLHGLDHVFMLPPLDPPLLAGRASLLDRASAAMTGPVGMEPQALFDRGKAAGKRLTCRAAIAVCGRLVAEILLAEPSVSLGSRCKRLRATGCSVG